MQTWLLVAFIAPFLWALVVLLDVYFTQKAYSEAAEGTIISAFYQGIVLLSIPFVGYSWPSSGWMFLLSGMCFIFSCHWYLRSLVIGGDGAIAQIVWNFSILLVPVFAWIISGEELQSVHYIGVALVFLGVVFFAWDKSLSRHLHRRIVKNMLPAIGAISLSMALQKEGFNEAPDFLPGFFTFSLGVVAGGCVTFLFHPRKRDIASRITKLCKRYWHSFLLGETLSVIAVFSSSYAISLAPSISFIVIIESLIPVFVMFFSFLLSRLFFVLKRPEYRALYEEQVVHIGRKVSALAVVIFGIYLIA
ncbi:MAG: hypothetical protein WAU28_05170 [Candidatus Moraniibacteriota bacterium]